MKHPLALMVVAVLFLVAGCFALLDLVPLLVNRSSGGQAKPGAEAKLAATLTVKVVSVEDQSPLARIRVSLTPTNAESFSSSYEDRAEGQLGECLLTGLDGIVRIRVPAGEEFKLDARGKDEDAAGTAESEVAALADGEAREVSVAVPTGADRHFFARFIAREDGRPLAGATLKICRVKSKQEKVVSIVRADDDGMVEVKLRSWDRQHGHVEAEGRAFVLFPFVRGCDRRDSPAIIPLSRVASLDAVVLDVHGAPLTGVTVRLSTDDYQLANDTTFMYLDLEKPEWRVEADGDGIVRFASLPADMPYVVEVFRGGKLLARQPEELALAPGAKREIEITLGHAAAASDTQPVPADAKRRVDAGLASIQGTLLDQCEQPVAHTTVWLKPAENREVDSFRSHDADEITARTSTDDHGRFTFARIAEGRWYIGPAPLNEPPSTADANLVAPIATAVEVTSAAGNVEVTLHVPRGLYIRGQVLDEAGSPLGDVEITAFDGVMMAEASANPEGRFCLGPLTDATFQVSGHQQSRLIPIVARAGEDQVVVRQGKPSTLVVRVTDAASGQPCEQDIFMAPADGSEGVTTHSTSGSKIVVEAVAPGRYAIFAATMSRKAALVRDVNVPSTNEIVLAVEPAAAVRIRNDTDAPWAHYAVRTQGVVVATNNLQAGTSERRVVPAGRIEIEFGLRKISRTRTLDLAVGEEREIWFGKEGWLDQSKQIVTDQAFQKLLPVVMERVAALRGHEFKSPVKASLVDAEQLARTTQRDLDRELPPAEREALERFYKHVGLMREGESLLDWIKFENEHLAGLYDPGTKQLYCLRGRSHVELTLVHELTHALQDQYLDLVAFKSVGGSEDGYDARHALIQGEAKWVSERYANVHASGREPEPATSNAQWRLSAETDLEFARAVVAARGREVLDLAWRAPPRSTEQILHPEKYVAGDDPPIAITPPSLELQGFSRAGRDTMGEALFGQWAAMLSRDAARAKQAAAGWGGDTWELWVAGQHTLLLWWTTWDTEVDANEATLEVRDCLRSRRRIESFTEADQHLAATTQDGTVWIERRGRDVLIIDGPLPEATSLEGLVARCWNFTKG